jgi:hypothetical protein
MVRVYNLSTFNPSQALLGKTCLTTQSAHSNRCPVELGVLSDLPEAVALLNDSWNEESSSGLVYTSDYLSWLISPPASLPVLAPAFFVARHPVAFVIGVPRTFCIGSSKLHLLMMSFFTVVRGHKGQGLGKRIWSECLRQAARAGYDGAFHYCPAGNPSNSITAAAASTAGFESQLVFTVRYLNALLSAGSSFVHAARGEAGAFAAAARALPPGLAISRLWHPDEIRWMFNRPHGVTQTGSSALTGYSMGAAGSARRAFVVEDVLWGTLDDAGKDAALAALLAQAAGFASIATVGELEYFDISPFRRAGFRNSRRALNAYLTLWSGRKPELPVRALYADVI